MTTLLAFAGAIAVLVVFHELGHYWVARRCGVKVLRFSVGFGKALYVKRFAGGETEYVISAVPLGGYVKMLDEREGEVAEHELHRAFNRKPVWQRMSIVAAGPIFNLLLAIVLYWGLYIYGVPGLKPILGQVAPHSAAASAGMQAQETITRINGINIPSWQDMRWTLLDLALQGAEVHVEGRSADGASVSHTLELKGLAPADLDGDFLQKLGLQPFQPVVQPVIGRLLDGGVAQRAGLRAGDHIVRAGTQPLAEWKDLVAEVRSHPGMLLRLEVERGSVMQNVEVTPETVEEGGQPIGKIGAAPRVDQKVFDALMTRVSYGPVAALKQAVQKTWDTAAVSLKMMGKMVLGEISMKNLSGPITIADYAGQSAQMGVVAYLGFLALISISLGVLNLLPIPLLDGGHLLYYTAELVKGSPVSDRAWEIGQNVGIALLVTLMAFALHNDISRLILG